MQKNEKCKSYNRRDFMKISAAAGAGIILSRSDLGWAEDQIKRYVIVGVGSRSRMYQRAIQVYYKQYSELAGLCDVNEGRLKLAQKRSLEFNSNEPPIYDAKEFDKMIAETKPDAVIVTTVDGFHHQYVVRGTQLSISPILVVCHLTLDCLGFASQSPSWARLVGRFS